MGSNLRSGRDWRWGLWMNSTLSSFNTMTEVPLSKAPNPQLLPGRWRVCSQCVCSLLTAVCVCALGWVKCRGPISSMGHHTSHFFFKLLLILKTWGTWSHPEEPWAAGRDPDTSPPGEYTGCWRHTWGDIYIYAFSRRFYPKRLTVHSSYSFTFYQHLCQETQNTPSTCWKHFRTLLLFYLNFSHFLMCNCLFFESFSYVHSLFLFIFILFQF